MKPSDLSFEARYAAWMDGALPESEHAAFEAECARRGIAPAQAEADRAAALRLGDLLRGHAKAAASRPIPHADFFNAEILHRIEAETPLPASDAAGDTSHASLPLFFPLRRLLWGGLGSLGAAALLFATLVFPTLDRVGPPPEYYAQVLKTADPAVSAVAMHPKEENVTVLWIEGLNYVPAEKSKN